MGRRDQQEGGGKGGEPDHGSRCTSRVWLFVSFSQSPTQALPGQRYLRAGGGERSRNFTRANLEALAFTPVGSERLEASPATSGITHLARLKAAFVADVESGMCRNHKPTNPNGRCSFSKAREPIRALN